MRPSVFRRVSLAAAGAATGLALLGGVALAWTGHVNGQPASFKPGAADGYYVWHNQGEDRFHLRTTDSAGRHRYTGVLRTDGHFRDVELVKKESDDHLQVLDDGHVLRFELVTAEGIDGIDFNVDGGQRVRFRLNQDGHRIDPSSIYLGEDGAHPRHNPFAIWRNHPHRHPRGLAAPATSAAPSPSTG